VYISSVIGRPLVPAAGLEPALAWT
jgi:hypothetical protein